MKLVKEQLNEMTVVKAIQQMPQLPQVQYDLYQQLRELEQAANKLGLYDAADFLASKWKTMR